MIVQTSNAPEAIGPYSQGIIAGNLLFCSGQIPINPQTGELVNSSIEAATEQSLKNLKEVLLAGGAKLTDVVKVTIFLVSLKDFSAVNNTYARFFNDHKPARSCIEVSALPKGALIEIEAIACIPDGETD